MIQINKSAIKGDSPTKNLSVDQDGCLGDVFFLQKLIHVLSEEYNVFHYIKPVFWDCGADQLINPATSGPAIQIPADCNLYQAWNHEKNWPFDVLSSKYEGIGIDWKDWPKYMKYHRYPEREQAVKNHFGLVDGEPYIVANRQCGFVYNHPRVDTTIPKDYDGKIIWIDCRMTPKIFDWCGVLEGAEEIHTVETSFQQVIETLDMKAKRFVVHPKHYKHSKPNLGRLFSDWWEWAEYTPEICKEDYDNFLQQPDRG